MLFKSLLVAHNKAENKGKFQLVRMYLDPTLNETVYAFGSANAALPTTTEKNGTFATVASLEAKSSAFTA